HAAVEEALLARGVSEAHFVGFSFGAYRAVAIACRGRVRPLSVVALSGYVDLDDEERAGVAALLALVRRGDDLAPVFEQLMLTDAARSTAATVAEVRRWAKAIDLRSLEAEGEAIHRCVDLRPD